MIGDRLSVGGGSDRLSVGGTGHMAADRLSLHSAGGGSGMENGGKPLYNGVVKYANHRDSHYSKSGASNPPAVGNSARYSANSGIEKWSYKNCLKVNKFDFLFCFVMLYI